MNTLTSINPNLSVFKTLKSAKKAFTAENKPCHLLFNRDVKVYLVDTAKDRLSVYSCYRLISAK